MDSTGKEIMHLFHVLFGTLRATGEQWVSTVGGVQTRYASFVDGFGNFLALPLSEVYAMPGE
jgi:hypothetical protein